MDVRPMSTNEKARRNQTASKAPYNVKEAVQSYLLVTPQVIGLMVFTLYPILWVLRYVFYDFDNVTETFIGLDNLIRIFTRDPGYWRSLLNTLILSFGKLVIELPLALLLAVVLKSGLKGRTFFRVVFYMPNVISTAIIGVVFSFLFSAFDGIVNNLLLVSGLISSEVNWFGNKWTSMSVIAIASIWQGFGINMLFFLSGLMNIPKELYECSNIDGASRFQQFVHITVPMLAPVMQIIYMLAMIGSIKMMDLVLVLSNGEPAGQTEVVMTYLFKQFFVYGGNSNTIPQTGYACAVGVVTSVIIGLLTVLYLRATQKMSSIN